MDYSQLSVWIAIEDRLEAEVELEPTLFPRLSEVVEGFEGNVKLKFQAGRDAKNNKSISGNVKVGLYLSCQRCLEPLFREFDVDFIWYPVQSEYEAELLGDDETILLLEEGVSDRLVHHLEDELLLAIPVIPYHNDDEECPGREFLKSQKQAIVEEEPEEEEKPFAQLADLLDN